MFSVLMWSGLSLPTSTSSFFCCGVRSVLTFSADAGAGEGASAVRPLTLCRARLGRRGATLEPVEAAGA
jgi:hypothetical protein